MTAAVLLAAGSSTRYGTDKLSEQIGGQPVWLKSFSALVSHPGIDVVGIVTSASLLEDCARLAPAALFVIEGGSDRQSSSRLGVEALPEDCDIILIHDAARPWVSEKVISDVIAAAKRSGAAFPGLAVTDTIKQIGGGEVTTLDRSKLCAVQTPQGAHADLMRRAHASGGAGAVDDMMLLERIGIAPERVEGDRDNRKITHRDDMTQLAAEETRMGLGYDIHRFSDDPDRPMILGGVEFDDRPGLDGHSDADSLIHAVVDSILGAAGRGDIGEHFPNTDPEWKNAPSSIFLTAAAEIVGQDGWQIRHIDVSVVAERPKILPKREEIKTAIAGALGINSEQVSIKATTNEGLGALGRGEGVAAYSAATITRTAR
jgi:2-C-methyl-D-erythritol 4-phosphate cytidylyltransferase/2-C-methyl-D-erythritol 2,4-cyclodiphosphate synthase